MTLFEIPDGVRAAWPRGARDPRERLVGSTEWLEFETPFVMQPILGGLGNIGARRILIAGLNRGRYRARPCPDSPLRS